MEKFKQLNLSQELLDAISHEGFVSPSEVQEKTIPLVLEGKDVIGSSATGSGKTLAFGAGIIDKISRGAGLQALVLTPTRELAEQVGQALAKFSRKKGLRVTQVYGGVSMGPQINGIRHSEIVVGTPGRLLDHLQRRTINLSYVKFLVLDEADRMLDMGFVHDVETIVKLCPKNRQTLLFSATLSKDIEYMAKKYMINPVVVAAGESVDPSKLNQIYYDVQHDMKFSLLVHLLKLEKNGVVMVFCNTRRNTDKVTRNLGVHGLNAEAIHGGLTQNRRSSVLKSFHSKSTLILVCTDIAARGLDIKDVSHVYNYDIPKTPSDYIHRIGRTARAGKNGIAISFVASSDHSEFKQIVRKIDTTIERQISPKLDSLRTTLSNSTSHNPSNRNEGRNQVIHQQGYNREHRAPNGNRSNRDREGRDNGDDRGTYSRNRGYSKKYSQRPRGNRQSGRNSSRQSRFGRR